MTGSNLNEGKGCSSLALKEIITHCVGSVLQQEQQAGGHTGTASREQKPRVPVVSSFSLYMQSISCIE